MKEKNVKVFFFFFFNGILNLINDVLSFDLDDNISIIDVTFNLRYLHVL